jgi:hypothetical protein
VRQRKQPPSSERLELEIEYTSEIMKAVNVEKMALRWSRVLPARLDHNKRADAVARMPNPEIMVE